MKIVDCNESFISANSSGYFSFLHQHDNRSSSRKKTNINKKNNCIDLIPKKIDTNISTNFKFLKKRPQESSHLPTKKNANKYDSIKLGKILEQKKIKNDLEIIKTQPLSSQRSANSEAKKKVIINEKNSLNINKLEIRYINLRSYNTFLNRKANFIKGSRKGNFKRWKNQS